MESENLKIGARGWRHKQWVGPYYPDDLPVEWQLTYYANDFQVVLVPVEYWEKSKGYNLEEWLEAVDENFRFYLECPSLEVNEERQRFQDQCIEMGGLLGGVIISDDMEAEHLDLHCPIVKQPLFENEKLCVGVLDKELDDLRKVRAWLEAFDNQCEEKQKRVFITNGTSKVISMETIVRIKMLSEMMSL